MKKRTTFLTNTILLLLVFTTINPNGLDYEKIYKQGVDKKNKKNYIFVNDTNCKLKLEIIRQGFSKNTKSEKVINKKGSYPIKYKTGTWGLNSLISVKISDVCEKKSETCDQAKKDHFFIDKLGTPSIFFIRRVLNKKNEQSFALHQVKNIVEIRKNKKSCIQGKCGRGIKTKTYVENNTPFGRDGFIKYGIYLPGRGDAYGILDNGGNRRKITCGDYRDAQGYEVEYYEKKKDGVYHFITSKNEKNKSLNIKHNKENRLIFKFNRKKKKINFNVFHK